MNDVKKIILEVLNGRKEPFHKDDDSVKVLAVFSESFEDIADEIVKKLNKEDKNVSFNESEKDEFIETTIFLNSQNLSGRETEDELYKQGIIDCFDDLIKKINER